MYIVYNVFLRYGRKDILILHFIHLVSQCIRLFLTLAPMVCLTSQRCMQSLCLLDQALNLYFTHSSLSTFLQVSVVWLCGILFFSIFILYLFLLYSILLYSIVFCSILLYSVVQWNPAIRPPR